MSYVPPAYYWRGVWSVGTTYLKNSWVSHAGAVWLSVVQNSVGVEPADDSGDWDKFLPHGTPGTDGTQISFGPVAPENGLGIAGDVYVDIGSGDVYQKSGSWGVVFNLISLVAGSFLAMQVCTTSDHLTYAFPFLPLSTEGCTVYWNGQAMDPDDDFVFGDDGASAVFSSARAAEDKIRVSGFSV